jgi:hypothetical protein
MSRWYIVCVPIAVLTLQAAPANAQPAGIQGSIAGFVLSITSKTVRPPQLGISGATHVAPGAVSTRHASTFDGAGKLFFVIDDALSAGPAPANREERL